MMLQRAHGVLFMVLGAISVVDGWRIAMQARDGGSFDAIGPDRYLLALGMLMLVAGLWRLLSRPEPRVEHAVAAGEEATGATATLALTLAMLAAFAALTPVVGFSVACLTFLAFQFRWLGGWPLWKCVSVAAAAAAVFHAAFIWLADMPLPRGNLWE